MKKKLIVTLTTLALLVGSLFAFAACKDNVGDYDYLKEKGNMIIGYTIYPPLAYENAAKGYDVEVAKLVGEKLGLEVKFQEIQWDQKVIEINSKNIDCIWNGFTITDEMKQSVDFTAPYLSNSQVLVVRKDALGQYTDINSFAGKEVAYEAGSAGQKVMKESGVEYVEISSESQISALLEIKSGTVDACVVDGLLYAEMATQNPDEYANVALAPIDFDKENFGIGFRKGSDMVKKVEDALKELKEEGKIAELAAKYNVTKFLID